MNASRSTRSRRRWWAIYFACSAVVLLALVWITVTVLRLESAETQARAEAAHQETIRLSLWRMDSWLSSRLAVEAARPYFEYQAFFPPQRGYTRLLNPIEPGDVLTPSPLLSFRSEYFPLHFQLTDAGELTSPQFPHGELYDLAAGRFLSQRRLDENRRHFERASSLLGRSDLAACVAESEEQAARLELSAAIAEHVPEPSPSNGTLGQLSRTQQEWTKRKDAYVDNVLNAPQPQIFTTGDGLHAGEVSVGSLVPLWMSNGEAEPALLFIRRVRVDTKEIFQGFLCEWDRLRAALCDEIDDLSPEAQLVPVTSTAPAPSGTGMMLAAIPVALQIPLDSLAGVTAASPARSTLLLTWLAVLSALVAAAITLRSSITFGESRSRFASAVTHELRTPLTTFQMYTEMLAKGMVEDTAQRQTYLETLEQESLRLSALVENVLAYARLEEGPRSTHRRAIGVEELLERVAPTLERRVREADMSLETANEAPHETTVVTDVDAIGQILFNLVDNACKYGRADIDPSVRIEASLDDGRLRISVHDNGPGIGPAEARHVFAPFERGTYNDGSKPGVGLGLALSRGLARDLGGELVLETPSHEGAWFDLWLPLGGQSA